MNNNLTIEWKFATFWLIFEFCISFALTAYLAKRLLLNRIRNRCKSLSGLKIVITNGHLKLSQELSKHLKSVYNCQTFLIGNDNHLTTSSTDVNQQTIHQCSLLNHNDLQQFTKNIIKEAGHIDIVIENNWHTDVIDSKTNCDEFIKTTSETIHSTLNLLAHFVPILCQSKHGGYFVTIQRQKKNGMVQHPFLNTRSDMNEFINCLTSTNFTPDKQRIQFSTIIVANDIDKTKCLELIDKIVNGLKTRKEIIDITSTNTNRSLIEYLVKLIKA